MKKIERLNKAMKDYKKENGKEYKRLIISEKFYNELGEESSKEDPKKHARNMNSVTFNFRNMEIKMVLILILNFFHSFN